MNKILPFFHFQRIHNNVDYLQPIKFLQTSHERGKKRCIIHLASYFVVYSYLNFFKCRLDEIKITTKRILHQVELAVWGRKELATMPCLTCVVCLSYNCRHKTRDISLSYSGFMFFYVIYFTYDFWPCLNHRF